MLSAIDDQAVVGVVCRYKACHPIQHRSARNAARRDQRIIIDRVNGGSAGRCFEIEHRIVQRQCAAHRQQITPRRRRGIDVKADCAPGNQGKTIRDIICVVATRLVLANILEPETVATEPLIVPLLINDPAPSME